MVGLEQQSTGAIILFVFESKFLEEDQDGRCFPAVSELFSNTTPPSKYIFRMLVWFFSKHTIAESNFSSDRTELEEVIAKHPQAREGKQQNVFNTTCNRIRKFRENTAPK